MSTNYVKNFDCGKLSLDLPYANCTYELPLLSFADMRGSVSLSLVFNQRLKEENANTFNISAGYKLNLQKRLIFTTSNAKFEEGNGKRITLYSYSGGYTFDDESQRIIRQTTGGYTLEYPDYSKETYDTSGKITAVYDKYGDKILSYKYTNNILTSVVYRESNTSLSKTVNFAYNSSSKLTSITYSAAAVTTTVSYGTNQLTLSHYSGVSYTLYSSGKTFTATVSGTDNSQTYSYAKKCMLDSTDECAFILSDFVGTDEVNKTTYKYPDLSGSPNTACDYVDITDDKGVKTRVQFSGDKIAYSYEIPNGEVEFYGGIQQLSPVNVYRTGDDLFNAQSSYTQRYCDGTRVNLLSDGSCTFNAQEAGMNKGYFIISGWVKKKNTSTTTTPQYMYAGAGVGDFRASFYLGNIYPDKWMYFAFKYYQEATYLYLNFPGISTIDVKDLRISYRPTQAWSAETKDYVPIAEDVLIHKTNSTVIPIKDVTFSCDGASSAYDWVSFEDLLKFKMNKKKGVNTSEFYYSRGKNIVTIDTAVPVTFTYNSSSYSLDSYYIGRRSYSEMGFATTIIKDDDSGCFLLSETVNESLTVLKTEKLNNSLDKIYESAEGVTTTYQRSNGLVSSVSVSGCGTVSTSYDETNGIITETDEFGKVTTYTMDKTWGVIVKTALPSGSNVEDDYDKDKCTLEKRTFGNSNGTRANTLGYKGGRLSSLSGCGLSYAFTYTKDDLTGVSKAGSAVVQHTHTKSGSNEIITSYYPQSSGSLYSISKNYDKYGRISSISNVLANTYDVFPSFNSSSGALVASGDNNSAHLAMSVDSLVGETSRYTYGDDGLMKTKTVSSLASFSDKISTETLVHDKIKRLSSETYKNEQDSTTLSGVIEYVKAEGDPSADSRVKKYSYKIGDDDKAVTTNTYASYNRLSSKTLKLGTNTKLFTKSIEYNNTRVKRVADVRNNVSLGSNAYEYDSLGRITKDSFTLQGTSGIKTYEYDRYGQLTRENNPALDKTYLYVYNGNGNVTAKQIYSYTTAATSTLGTNYNQKIPYSYDSTHKDRLTSYDSKAISYNANGEVSSYDGWNYTWTRGKLTTLRTTISSSSRAVRPPSSSSKTYTYKYNAQGQRVEIAYSYLYSQSSLSPIQVGEVTSSLKTFNYDSRGRLIREIETKELYGGGTTNVEIIYLYDESSMVGMQYTRNATTSLYYFRRSPQGDVDAIYDSNGNLKVRYIYDAWGNCTVAGNTVDNVLANENPIRYRGYYYDRGTGLYYLNSRYYSPEWGRFISPDEVAYLDVENVNGLNLYAYCNNDPVNYADPSGHAVISVLVGMGIAALIGAAIGAGSYAVGQAVDYAITGDFEWSWGGFVGSAVGGAIGGAITFLLPFIGIGSAAVAAGISGATTTAGMMLGQNITDNTEYTAIDILFSSVITGIFSALSVGVMSKIRIQGLNAGRGSYSAISNQMYTKFRKQIIRKITTKTFAKMLTIEAYNSIAGLVFENVYNFSGLGN